MHTPSHTNVCKFFNFQLTFSQLILHLKCLNFAELLNQRCFVQCFYTFLILANFNLFEFSATILEKGLFPAYNCDKKCKCAVIEACQGQKTGSFRLELVLCEEDDWDLPSDQRIYSTLLLVALKSSTRSLNGRTTNQDTSQVSVELRHQVPFHSLFLSKQLQLQQQKLYCYSYIYNFTKNIHTLHLHFIT